MLPVDPSLIDRIHRIAMDYGGEYERSLRDAVRDEGCLPAICEYDLYGDPVERAAYYLHRIATRHPYVEGNKRTAYLTALLIIWEGTGGLLKEDQKENDGFVRRVAGGDVPMEDVAAWLRSRIIR